MNKRKILICVLLLAAACIIADLTAGAGGVCLWARSISPHRIVSAAPWGGEYAAELPPLSAEECAELSALLNSLTRKDFTRNRHLQGGTPTFGIRLTTHGGVFHLNEAISPHGTLEVEYLGTLWWIDSDALAAFVRQVTTDTENVPTA